MIEAPASIYLSAIKSSLKAEISIYDHSVVIDIDCVANFSIKAPYDKKVMSVASQPPSST